MNPFKEAVKATFIHDGLSEAKALSRYKKRRDSLLDTCALITVINGVTQPASANNPWHMPDCPLYQNPEMLYLTGLNQSHVALLLNPFTKKQILFLPKTDEKKEFWEGHRFSVSVKTKKAGAAYLGVDQIKEYTTLPGYLADQLKKHQQTQCGLFYYQAKKTAEQIHDNHWQCKQGIEEALHKQGLSVATITVEPLLKTRLKLDGTDKKNSDHANKLSAKAFESLCKSILSYTTETQVAGHLKGELLKASYLGQSFPAIVASGKNASILHYQQNNQRLDPQGMLLLDFGCRYQSMSADISRTIPVNGRFNPLQACLYTIVLNAQKKVQSLVKPGVSIDELNTQCWAYIEEALKLEFFKKGGKAVRPYKKQPHNVSHLMGHMVHDGDPYRDYRTEPLQEGMLISNEPGLYGQFEWTCKGKKYSEHIGIRIEDNLFLTKTGCQNMSQSCPKEIQDLETLIS